MIHKYPIKVNLYFPCGTQKIVPVEVGTSDYVFGGFNADDPIRIYWNKDDGILTAMSCKYYQHISINYITWEPDMMIHVQMLAETNYLTPASYE
jgi:hypothetical protein